MTIKLDKFKEAFLLKKEELLRYLKNSESEIDVEGDEVDEASASSLGSLSQKLSKRTLKQISDIDKAIERIEDGSFGECEECGKDIGEKRLMAKPDAITCISCAERLEHILKQYAG
jgi:DnaK suppressor protein